MSKRYESPSVSPKRLDRSIEAGSRDNLNMTVDRKRDRNKSGMDLLSRNSQTLDQSRYSSVLNRGNGTRRLDKGAEHADKVNVLSYCNQNGPGDYEIPTTIGANIPSSVKMSSAKYSIGLHNKLPANAEYSKGFLMKDSPAIKYHPK